MHEATIRPFRLRLWLVVLAFLVCWVAKANAATVPDTQTLLARPAWALGNPYVSRQEFGLLVNKVVKARTGKPVAAGPETTAAWITRAQAVNDLVRAFGFDDKLSHVDLTRRAFKDVPEAHPFRSAVYLAGQTNLISGYPDGTFQPDEPLRWIEASTMLQILRGWTLAMPEQVPTWVAEKQARTSAWYRLFSSTRLGLTIAYGLFAVFYFVRAYRQPIKNRTRRLVTNTLLLVSILMVVAWINDLAYASGMFHRTFYEIGAFLSLVIGFFLLKAGQSLATRAPEPARAPKTITVELGYVDCIDHAKGELFVIDPISKRKVMVMVTPETKVYTRQKSGTATGFLSEIQVGDVVNVQGASHQRGTLVSAQSLLIVAQSRPATQASGYQLRPLYLETQTSTQRSNRNVVAYR